MADPSLFIGIDVGTSGCRAIAIDETAREVARAEAPLPPPERAGAGVAQDPVHWWDALCTALDALLTQIPRTQVRALCVDGTSGTVFLADGAGMPLAPALLYSDNRAATEAKRIGALAPRESAAHGTGSGLAKLLWLYARHPQAVRAHTPADWFAGRLTGKWGRCDSNSALKLGWDPIHCRWPAWIPTELGLPSDLFPEVVAPGESLGVLAADMAHRFGLPPHVQIVAGTTDSTAAILATGAAAPGDAVTSLGSTLVMKIVSDRPVFAPEYGVYSQPYGTRWLAGGGSNSGGAVLRHYFTDAQLSALESRMDSARPTGLDYYPLLAPGERFPINDPALAPRLAPRPADEARFLQGMLEAMARIEADAYRLLIELGAPAPKRILSAGGGAQNGVWTAIRRQQLGVPVRATEHQEAAYGSALLALRALL